MRPMAGAIAGACYGVEGISSQGRETVEDRGQIERLARELWKVKTGGEQRTEDGSEDGR